MHIALQAAQRGGRVALLARGIEPLRQAEAAIAAAGGQGRAWPTDITDDQAVRSAVEGVVGCWGRIDVLINAAGIKVEGAVEQLEMAQARAAMEVNYLGALRLCQAVLPHMRRQGAGQLINVSSVLGKRATPQRGAYSASKAALNALTDALRTELAGTGIVVTLVCPGRLEASQNGLLASATRRAASRIVACIGRARREVILTPAGRALVALNAVAPGVVDRIVTRWRAREG